jgi:DNA-binding NarL/FixJ family response regulator
VNNRFSLSSDDTAPDSWHDGVTMNEKLANTNGKVQSAHGLRVIIADDQQPIRRALAAVLAFAPRPVEVVGEAADGEEVLRLVGELQPDVVVMDVNMPRLDGLEATRRIKSQWPQVRVVALTMSPSHRTVAMAAGVDAFLLKGDPLDALQAAITLEPNATARRQNTWMRDEGSQTQIKDQQQKE